MHPSFRIFGSFYVHTFDGFQCRFIYPCFDSRTSPTVDNQPYRKMKTFSQLSGKEIGGGTAINGRFR